MTATCVQSLASFFGMTCSFTSSGSWDGNPVIGASPTGTDGPFIHKKTGETMWWNQAEEMFFKVSKQKKFV